MFLRRLLAALLFCATASAAAAQSLYPSPTFNATTTQSLTVGGTPQSFPPSGQIAGTTDTQTLSNKTLTAPTVNGGTLNGTFGGNPSFSGQPSLPGVSSGTQTNCLGLSSGNQIVTSSGACGTGSGLPSGGSVAQYIAQTALGVYQWVFGVTTDASISALRSNTIAWPTIHVQGYYGAGTLGGGDFEYVSTDSSTADNSCNVFVDASGHRYYRKVHGPSERGLAVSDCGAKGDGTTDDTTAINAGDTVAAAEATALWFAPGRTYIVNGTVGSTVLHANSWWFSPGQNAIIQFKTDIGHGAWWQASNADNAIAGVVMEAAGMTGITLVGPGCSSPTSCSYTAGVAPANMNGLQFGATAATAPSPMIRDVTVEGFYAGIVINTNYGHWHLIHDHLTGNFYGIYLSNTGGDGNIQEGDSTGNTMAAMACAHNGACLTSNGVSLDQHWGFSPYGIYQEPGIGAVTFGGFIDDWAFIHSGFECIGNGAFKMASEAETGPTGFAGIKIVKHGGFSWSADFSRTSPYCSLTGYAVTASGSKTCTVSTANNPSSGQFNGSGLLTSCATSPAFQFGQQITGTGIAAHSYVLSDDGAGNVRISLPVTSSPGAETVSAAFDWNYPIDVGELVGVFDVDMGSAPADAYNRAGAFEPGSTGSIVHAQLCSDVAVANGGRVILRYTSDETPPHANNQAALYVCDSDPYSSGAVAASRVIFGNGYDETAPNLMPVTVANGSSTGSNTFYVSMHAAGGTTAGLAVSCGNATEADAVTEQNITQGTGANSNIGTIHVTLASNAAGAGGDTINCVMNGPE